ncbi:SDR family oxidoreductase [Rhodococcus sp. NPDC127528]|uniref:SDR family oxidoreductase n=1 Tax=unclassified Rhodococcus (in: high G+C Gram-positive bacteria) TaxID=192944 RepID=UPI003636D20B
MAVANPADFTGTSVLITGGTKGIGRVVAETFLGAGAQVTVCARSEPETVPEADGRRAAFVPVDVRDADAVRAMVESAHAAMGGLDVLINNAGGSPDADAAEVSPRFVEKVVALNLLAPFYVAQAANRLMQRENGGSIVNIGSVSGQDPQPGTAAYSAAKGGLLVLTKALALEWAPKVRVNHITTGLIRTEAAAAVYGADGGAAVTKTLPIGRMAVPSDIAGACLFLAGPLSAYVNGADIAVHGGGEYPARYLATHPEIG